MMRLVSTLGLVSCALALVHAAAWGADISGAEIKSLLEAEGIKAPWQVSQEDAGTFGRFVYAFDMPRQISPGVCLGRRVMLGVQAETLGVTSRNLAPLVALVDCAQATPQDMAPALEISDERQLVDAANALRTFLRSDRSQLPGVEIKYSSRELQQSAVRLDVSDLQTLLGQSSRDNLNELVIAIFWEDKDRQETVAVELIYNMGRLAQIYVRPGAN